MNVKSSAARIEKPVIELGDVVEWKGGFYIAMHFKGEYVLKDLCGCGGLNGVHESLEDLNKATSFNDKKFYPKEKFQFVLEEIVNGN